MGITVDGSADVAAALRQIDGAVRARLVAAVQEEAQAIRDDEQTSVPVDTGALRDGITVRQVGELAAEVGIYDAELVYAIWIEWGRQSASAQPFANPAAEQSRQRWPKRAGDAIKEVAGGQ